MSVQANGVHHLAISTADIKSQIEFFSQVLGAKLVGLFWMHGVPGGRHAFCELNAHSSISFVELPQNADIEPVLGVTHAGSGAGPSAPGTLQHLAFNVDTVDELVGLRDRIRSHGINVIGQIDHGMCQSIYFAGPEGLTLEIATNEVALDPQAWIDPEVVELAGISADELALYCDPPAFESQNGAVPQPPIDPTKPHMNYPPEVYKAILAMPDEELTNSRSYSEPPVSVKP